MRIRRRQLLALMGTVGCATPEPRQAPKSQQASAASPLPATQPPATPQPATPQPAPPAAPRRRPFALFERFPELEATVPRAAIGEWPTPVLAVPTLAKEIGATTIHVKRDDLSAKPYGGGKPRKLELFLGEAVKRKLKGVVTFGGVGSHHAAATAIYAERVGLSCRLMLMPQPPTDEVRRVLLVSQQHGAELELVGSLAGAEARARRLRDHLVIPAGGTSPLGNVGFVSAALELAEQVKAGALPEPDLLYIAVGTLGSAAGLAVGLAAAQLATRIVGVRSASWEAASPKKLRALHVETVAWLRKRAPSFPSVELAPTRFRFENRFLGKGYAQPTRAGAAATKRAAELGLRLDPTYTAKAFAALLASQGEKRHVVFWHTHSHHPLEPRAGGEPLPDALRPYARIPSR